MHRYNRITRRLRQIKADRARQQAEYHLDRVRFGAGLGWSDEEVRESREWLKRSDPRD